MIKLKDILGEDFGGSYGGNKNRRWSKPLYDDKGSSPIVVTAWDDIVDEYNGKHGYSTSTKSDSRVYDSEIGNLSVGMEWKVSFRNNNWRYQLYKLGQLANIFRNLDELISHFKDNNGGNRVTEPIIGEGGTFGRRGRETDMFGTKNLHEDFDQNNDGYPDATSGNNNDSEFAKLVTAIESALDALSDPNYPNYDPGEDIFLTTDNANEVISCELLSGPWKTKSVSAIKSVLKQFRNFIIDPNSLYKDSESINFDIVRK